MDSCGILQEWEGHCKVLYKDPVELNVIPDPLLPANTIFCISTLPPLESGVVLKKVANWLESVKGG